MNEQWKPLSHNKIQNGYYLSSYGRIRYEDNDPYEPEYHSSNGYDYSLFGLCREGNDIIQHQLFPIDDLIGMTFIPVPNELKNKPIKIIHIDGNNRNNHISNLKWVEDIEEWRDAKSLIITKSNVIFHLIPDKYEVSSLGRVRVKLTRELLSTAFEQGYEKINLNYIDDYGNISRKRTKIHRLMALSFCIPGYSENSSVVNHINGITTYNRIKNIEWVSIKQNVRHSFDTGLEVNPKGEFHPRAKFSDNQRKCLYEIIKTLPMVPPSLLSILISDTLPNITNDDIKYAKKLIRINDNISFPKLSFIQGKKFSQHDLQIIRSTIRNIFNSYGINQMEVYNNGHRKKS
jgi:hypothetical protein